MLVIFLLILQRRPNTRISKTFSAFKLLAYETIHIGQKKIEPHKKSRYALHLIFEREKTLLNVLEM